MTNEIFWMAESRRYFRKGAEINLTCFRQPKHIKPDIAAEALLTTLS